MDTKKCSKCGEVKAVEQFAKNASKKDGLQGHCRNCKSKQDALHYKENKDKQRLRVKENRAKNKAKVLAYKEAKGCQNPKCKETDPCCLDFHHIDFRKEKKKEFAISEMKDFAWDRIQSEIDKCIVLCANCHRKLHAGKLKPFWFLVSKINGEKVSEGTTLMMWP